MDPQRDEYELTVEEQEMAREHWDSLMFSFSNIELEAARLALAKAPLVVQWAVMADINQLWLQEYQPRRNENPFLINSFIPDPVQVPVEVETRLCHQQIEILEAKAPEPHAVSDYMLRFMQWLNQPLAFNTRTFSQRPPLTLINH
ncbi:hypothetical protein IAD21_03978 [Abditibacteriota bacterium]|nr:hypothetical protein IAD21_03978 [Abditibacteriota bacterium]